MSEQPRDPLHAWPIIDGPLKGHERACEYDYFYAAPVVLPGQLAPTRGTDMQVVAGRTEYRLCQLESGAYVWSCEQP